MKHSIKITIILLVMFFIAQLLGIAVNKAYTPEIKQEKNESGDIKNITVYSLPYGLEPPKTPAKTNFFSIIFSFIIAIFVMFLLMRYKAEITLRIWFFVVISIGIGITLNSFLQFVPSLPYYSLISLFLGVSLAYGKIFKRNVITHNASEILVYPGISAVLVPFLDIFFFGLLLIIISIYDMYAVWHSGFMQKMAKYQMKKVKVFAGFYIPYIGNKEKAMIEKIKAQKKSNNEKIKVHVAILGGGDVVFPMILAGIVLQTLGLLQAVIIAIGATLALAYLFYNSEKGKFYPAMPFISIGCFIALGIAYLI